MESIVFSKANPNSLINLREILSGCNPHYLSIERHHPFGNDDSKKSTARVTTAWTIHSLDTNGCLSRAATVLADQKYFVESTDIAVYGLKKGMTASFRCDYKEAVFVVAAYRKRPDQTTQIRTIEGLRDAFSGEKIDMGSNE